MILLKIQGLFLFSFQLMPVAPPIYLHRQQHFLPYLLPHYDPNHFLHTSSIPYNPSRPYLFSFSLKHSFPSLLLIHLSPSTSLLSIFNPFSSINIPFGLFLIQLALLQPSLVALETAFFALFFMLSFPLFSSVQF